MSRPDTAITTALLERIIGAECSLILLSCEEPDLLREHLRVHSILTGQALYAWRDGAGLRSLRDGESPVPGSRYFADALRHIAQSTQFGVYFFGGYPQPFDAGMIPQLRQVARMTGERVRRVVLLDPGTLLPASVESCEMSWRVGSHARPRLRDGRWIPA